MFEKIMIATDGSEASKNAAILGVNMASISCANVTAVYVVDIHRLANLHGYTSFSGLKDKLLGMMLREGEAATSEVEKMASDAGVHCDNLVAQGDPSDELLRISQESKMDLLVLGSIGRSGLEKFLLGSVAEKVVRNSKVPVMLVPFRKS